jgi:hypothetical protein
LDDWKSLESGSEEFVKSVELVACWENRNWYKGRLPKVVPVRMTKRRGKGKSAGGITDGPSTGCDIVVATLPAMKPLMDIATFKLGDKSSLQRRLNWIKDRLEHRGIDCGEWIWKVQRYDSCEETRKYVDRVTTDIAARIGLPSG